MVDDLSGGFRKNVPEGTRFIIGDLKNATFVYNLMEKEKFDLVYHLAAYAAEGLSHFIRNYNYQNNLVATTNLITQSVRVGTVKKFIFTSSIATYGSGRTPMVEDMEPLPEDPYGISKLACEYDLKAAHEMFGLDYVIFRPHNVYGPGQNMYDKYRNVVGIFLNQLQAGKPLTIFGDGAQTRKFSYISDVSYPIALSGIMSSVRNEIFNVGGDIATTVNELAAVTAQAWGNPEAVIKHLDARNEVAHAESDHHKLNCFFPGLPKPVGLREGMERMVAWAKTTGQYFKPVEFQAVEVKKKLPPSWLTDGTREVPALHHDASDNNVELSIADMSAPSKHSQVLRNTLYTTNATLHRVPSILKSHAIHNGKLWRQPAARVDNKQSPTLLTIHTAHNAWNMVRLMLLSLAAVEDNFDVLLIDDHSSKYDQNALAESWGVQTLRWGKPDDGPRGNTHSWNLAWQYAMKHNYEHLIICNNDVLIPNGTIQKLSSALDSGDWDWIVPIVSKRGSFYEHHNLEQVYGNVAAWTDEPLHYAEVARELKMYNKPSDIYPVKILNGYVMAFKVGQMKNYQYDSETKLLFDPKHVNTGNENELGERLGASGGRKGVHTTAFVFHFKGFTLYQGKNGRTSTDGYPVLDEKF